MEIGNGPKISCIVACDNIMNIGKGGKLPWNRISTDMKFFRKLTSGHTVIMGRKTFESLGSKALPDRKNIIISTTLGIKGKTVWDENGIYCYDIESALRVCKEDEEVFIIGGGTLYDYFWDKSDSIFITRIETSIPNCDVKIKPVDMNLYYLKSVDRANSIYKLAFEHYQKIIK